MAHSPAAPWGRRALWLGILSLIPGLALLGLPGAYWVRYKARRLEPKPAEPVRQNLRWGVTLPWLGLLITVLTAATVFDLPNTETDASIPADKLFSLHCSACHSVDGREGIGPTLAGFLGSMRQTRDGQEVRVDAAEFRRLMRMPLYDVDPESESTLTHDYSKTLTDPEVEQLIIFLSQFPTVSPSDSDA